MKPSRISISLNHDEWQALYQAAQADLRDMREEARYFVRETLKRMGLLQEKPEQAPDTS